MQNSPEGLSYYHGKIEALIYGQNGKINNHANNQYLAFAGLLHSLDMVLQQRTKEMAKLNSETSSQVTLRRP